jgi:hypothetical protein
MEIKLDWLLLLLLLLLIDRNKMVFENNWILGAKEKFLAFKRGHLEQKCNFF